MADAPFDRVNFGQRERPVSDDWNRVEAQLDRALRATLEQMLGGRTSNTSHVLAPGDVFMGQSFRVYPSSPAAMEVNLRAGLGLQYLPGDVPTDIGSPDFLGVDDLANYKPLVLQSGFLFAVPAAPAGPNSRIDIIEVKATRALVDAEARKQLNTTSGNFDPHNFYKTLSFKLDGLTGTVADPAPSTAAISYKTGTPANPGVAPATTAGYIKIAEVLVGSAVASIDEDVVVDRRKIAGLYGSVRCSMSYLVAWNGGGGGQTVTIEDINAPPGVRMAVQPVDSTRGRHYLYAVAGEATKAAINVSVACPTNDLIVCPMGVSQLPVDVANGFHKGNLLTATPATKVATGQKLVVAEVTPVKQTAGVTSIVDVDLESLRFHATIDIAYH